MEITNNKHERQENELAQVAIMLLLADRDSTSELNAIAVHIEDDSGGPDVGISTRFPPAQSHLHNDREHPDGDHTERKNLRWINTPVHSEHYELFRHAADSVEQHVARKGPLDAVVVEVIDEDLNEVVKEMPLLRAVNHGHQLLVGAADPHHTTGEDKQE